MKDPGDLNKNLLFGTTDLRGKVGLRDHLVRGILRETSNFVVPSLRGIESKVYHAVTSSDECTLSSIPKLKQHDA